MNPILSPISAKLAAVPLSRAATVRHQILQIPEDGSPRRVVLRLFVEAPSRWQSVVWLRPAWADWLQWRSLSHAGKVQEISSPGPLVSLRLRSTRSVEVVDLAFDWLDERYPLRYPFDFPEVLRSRLRPAPMATTELGPLAPGPIVSMIGVQSGQGSQMYDASISRGERFERREIGDGSLHAQFVGADWGTVSAEQRLSTIAQVELSARRLGAVLPGRPCGEVQLRIGPDGDAKHGRSAAALYVARARLGVSANSADFMHHLTYQLAGLWWGAAIRLLGPQSERALTVIREELASHVAGATSLHLPDGEDVTAMRGTIRRLLSSPPAARGSENSRSHSFRRRYIRCG